MSNVEVRVTAITKVINKNFKMSATFSSAAFILSATQYIQKYYM